MGYPDTMSMKIILHKIPQKKLIGFCSVNHQKPLNSFKRVVFRRKCMDILIDFSLVWDIM